MRAAPVCCAATAALLVSALPFTGCTYLTHRGEDALDIVDVGVSLSSRPGFALYYDFVPVIPIGYGHVDGTFAGLGGGRFGVMPHYERSMGAVLWGREEVGFGRFDADDPRSVNSQRVGLVGLAQRPVPGPDYMISCPHYLHLGWIGLVGTPRYLQMLDFLLGWTTLDICSDDGRTTGIWPWLGEESPPTATAEAAASGAHAPAPEHLDQTPG
jgi:hypothetical protein